MVRVLVIDDSAVARQAIAAALAGDRSIRVLAAVADPLLAMQRMALEWPDVIVLDLEMPRMDGITFLRRIMEQRPTPVVICSSVTTTGATATMQALAAGAVSVMAKPRLGAGSRLHDISADLVHAVRVAAKARVRQLGSPLPGPGASRSEADTDGAFDRIVAIGTSTGGPQALEFLLTGLPASAPPLLVVQHMPERFTSALASRLDGLCRVEVKEAADGDRLRRGRVFIAPGGLHMTLVRSGGAYAVHVRGGPLVHHHRPSVDVLFRSVAKEAGSRALGIIMTGMGSDGALGLKAMHEAHARTLAQDEASSVVFGMPQAAIRLGAVDRVLPLRDIGTEIVRTA